MGAVVVLMTYSVRKRAAWLRNSGQVKHWFRLQIAMGLAATVLVIFHANFELHSANATVALS